MLKHDYAEDLSVSS